MKKRKSLMKRDMGKFSVAERVSIFIASMLCCKTIELVSVAVIFE
jgi:hypothetical protein